MQEIIWMFPILFMVHDMEEVIGFGTWLKKNRSLLDQKYPRISNTYRPFSTEGMAAAVMEELLLCLVVCTISRITSCYGLWLGVFIAYAMHLLIHIGQSIVVKQYIPAVITSILCLPVSLCFIVYSIKILSYSGMQIFVYSCTGMAVVVVNLKIAHGILHTVTRKLVKMEG